jgi:hypothetical protein
VHKFVRSGADYKCDERKEMFIFLSHSNKDDEFVRKLARDLSHEYINVWFDDDSLDVGDRLSIILSKIKEADSFVVVISRAAQKSDWVKREVELAKNVKKRILPVLIEDIEEGWGRNLNQLVVADFRDYREYRRSFYRLVSSIKNIPNPLYLTAKEAARLVKTKESPSGELSGISHQGVCMLYSVAEAVEWVFADSISGRSRFWVVEFFNPQNAGIESYAVKDGDVKQFPSYYLLDSNLGQAENSGIVYSCNINMKYSFSEKRAEQVLKRNEDLMERIDKRYIRFRPIPIAFAYIDSDDAIDSAIKYLSDKHLDIKNNNIFVLMKLEHDKIYEEKLIWKVSFFDFTMAESAFTLGIDAITGNVKYPKMNSEVLNVNFFHVKKENEKFIVSMNRQLNAIDSRVWDIPDMRKSVQQGLTAAEAMKIASEFLISCEYQQWQFGFISNTGVLEPLVSPIFTRTEEGLMSHNGKAGQWVIEVYTGEPKRIVEGEKKGYAYEFRQILITSNGGLQFSELPFIGKFTSPLSQIPQLPQLLMEYECARNLAISSIQPNFFIMSVALGRYTSGTEWKFRFYYPNDTFLRVRVTGDGTKVIALDYFAETGELILEDNIEKDLTNDFHDVAKQWVAELTKKGVFKGLDNEVLFEITKDYESRIEDIVLLELIDKIDEQNKLEDFDKIADSNSAEIWKFLHANIPNLNSIVMNAVANAKSRIIGNIDRL